MQYTTNFNFKKPELTDAPPDITELNANWEAIDGKLSELDTNLDGKADKDLGNVTAADFLATVERSEAVEYIFNQNRATDAEAIAGTDNVKYMTPHLTKAAIDSSTPYRVGDLRFLGYPLADSDYLPCNGQLVDGTAYPELYAKIGTNYGGVEPLEDFTIKTLSFTVRDLAYGNGKLVAVGYSGKIAISSDNGVSWSEQTYVATSIGLRPAANVAFDHVQFGGGQFVIFSGNDDYYLTGDGSGTWQLNVFDDGQTNSYKIKVGRMLYGNSMWVIGFGYYQNDAFHSNAAMYSTDNMQSWTEIPAGQSAYTAAEAQSWGYGNGVFLFTFPCTSHGDGVGKYYSIRTGIFNGTSFNVSTVSTSKGDGGRERNIVNPRYVDGSWFAFDTQWGYLMQYVNNVWQEVCPLAGGNDLIQGTDLQIACTGSGVYTSFDGSSWRRRANTGAAKRGHYLGDGAWALLMSDGTIALTQENLCQFYIPGYNSTMKYCYIKATEGGRTYYQAPTESGEENA